jgi:predicted secreted hydrolase
MLLLAALRASGARRGAYPPSCPASSCSSRATRARIPTTASSGGTSRAGCRTRAAQPLGFQVTFFRVRPGLGESNPSRFAPRQVLFGHAAIADPAHGRCVMPSAPRARASTSRLRARDAWTCASTTGRCARTAIATVAAVQGDDFSLRLDLDRVQPPLLQGERGFSRKGPSAASASYYYSLPQLRVSGEIIGRRPCAARVTGEAWFDHEWSSDVMDEQARGWDWMGVNLDDGGALMAFRMRDEARVARAGRPRRCGRRRQRAHVLARGGAVDADAHLASPRTGAEYPVAWRVQVGEREFDVEPLLDDAELDSRSSTGTIYWEGPVRLLVRPAALRSAAATSS